MKTPDEIKKGMECCMDYRSCTDYREAKCPYNDIGECADALLADALALIQQLEAKDTKQYHRIAELEKELAAVKQERDAAVADLSFGVIKCDVCKHGRFFGNECIGLFGDGGCSFEWRGVCQDTEVQEDA
jgi:hypothetical protein